MRQLTLTLLAFLSLNTWAQPGQILEEIVAVVGDYIILKSELETEYLQSQKELDTYDGDLKCEILNQLIHQKLFLHKAEIDSTIVDDNTVESEVDRRIKYYASQIGSEAKLEKYLGKSIAEYKQTIRGKVKEQMIIQEVRRKFIADIKVSPTEIRDFYYGIPQDSLPVIEAEVQLAQIVLKPTPNQFAKEYAKEKVQKIRNDIIKGLYSFEFAAKTNSEDPGSAVNGGELGYFGRGTMVKAFEREAFRLEKDSISQVIESEYGYHILQVIDRKGETVNARHILIKPLIVDSDIKALKTQANTLLRQLKSDSITLCKVAKEYSKDAYTSEFCGYFTDPNSGLQQVPIEALDQSAQAQIRTMKPGTYSDPYYTKDYDGSEIVKFYYLDKVIPQHTANLKDDYQKIQAVAKEQKQAKELEKWAQKYKKNVFISIDPKYKNCEELQTWKGLDN